MSNAKPTIKCFANGPYLLKFDEAGAVAPSIQMTDGETVTPDSGVVLCRCGKSGKKPFCDGSHRDKGFSDEKLADGSQDHRTSYTGKQITVHDNRGICAHAGYCTEQLSTVFKMKQEPWIDPDGASVEEIIELVKQCPSGAISYSLDDVEHQDAQDTPHVSVIKDGPYAICGIELVDQPLGEGVSVGRYTLCRCGASNNKPFCDGSHWDVGFKDNSD